MRTRYGKVAVDEEYVCENKNKEVGSLSKNAKEKVKMPGRLCHPLHLVCVTSVLLILLLPLTIQEDGRTLLLEALHLCRGEELPEEVGRKEARFSATDSKVAPVRIAIIGAGISGLTAAYTLEESNKLQEAGHSSAATFDVTVFEALEHVGGHSWTFNFPTKTGGTYPVDMAYAYNPTLGQYETLRRFERKHQVHLKGPLQQRVFVHTQNGDELTHEKALALDRECDRFNEILKSTRKYPTVYAIMTVRQFMWLHGFSDDFFLYRLYPPVRFVIVSGSKARLLDSSVLAGLDTFKLGWASCYNGQLHGDYDWYTVAGGSEAHIQVHKDLLGNRIRTSTPVSRVQLNPDGKPGVLVSYAEGGKQRNDIFDAVIMATQTDDALRILGPDAPSFLKGMTTEPMTCVLHSDASLLPPGGEAAGNMFYTITSKARSDYANGTMSVLWDSIHGDHVEPRPILTYNPEPMKGNRKLEGEVLRIHLKHVHLPSAASFVRLVRGLASLHNVHDQRLFFAGAWAHKWSLGHFAGVQAGVVAAESVGARPNPESFFMTSKEYSDKAGWREALLAAKGKWPQAPSEL